ncbi:MAG: hydroxymethylbilane synthase [Dehalococcoidia bacterium]
MKRSIVIGTRGSPLALKQAQEVLEGLTRLHPERVFEVQVITSQGDRNRRVPISHFGSKGVFVTELQRYLRKGEIDIAAHSMKDMPSEDPSGLCIAAVPPRQDPRDVLVTAEGAPLAQLPRGARIGSGSPRRSVQLKAARPDIEVLGIRGNIDTRMSKVRQGQYAGVVLAAAGLLRMGWQDRITEYLPVEVCLPAVGQGALAVEVRADDEESQRLLEGLEHPPSRSAVEAERALLRGLGGGCMAPIAAYGYYEDGALVLRGMVADPEGSRIIKAQVQGVNESPVQLGAMLAEKLLSLGAAKLMEMTKV